MKIQKINYENIKVQGTAIGTSVGDAIARAVENIGAESIGINKKTAAEKNAAAKTVKSLIRKADHAEAKNEAKKAKAEALAARKAAQVAKTATDAANRMAIAAKLAETAEKAARKAAIAAEDGDGYEVGIDFENVDMFVPRKIKIGEAVMTRSRVVYGGPRKAAQAFDLEFDGLTGEALVKPQIQELADSLQAREGFLQPAKYPCGFVTIQDNRDYSLPVIWSCHKEGITEEVLPLILSGNKSYAKVFQSIVLESKKPILLSIDKTGMPHLFICKKTTYADDSSPCNEGLVYVEANITASETNLYAGKNCFTIDQISEMIDRENSIAADKVKAGKKAMPWRAYTVDNDSSSTVRRESFVLRKMDYDRSIDIFDENKYVEKRNMIVNAIGGNVGTLLNSINIGKEVPADKLVKKVGRPSLLFTNSARGLKPRAMMFFTGEFGNGNKFSDGFGFISEDYIRRMLKSYGYDDIKSTEGLGFQDRIATSKGYTLTVSQNSMSNLIRTIQEKSGKEVKWVDIDDSVAVHEAAVAIEKGDKDYKDRLVFISPKDTLYSDAEYFADGNMLKAVFDFDGAKEISLMEMCHPSHGTSTSSQILSCVMAVPGFHEAVMDIALETIKDIFSFKAKDVLNHDFVNGFDKYADDVLMSINPHFVFSDKAAAKRQVTSKIKAAMNRINNLSFDLKGGYMKALPDLGGFFGVQLLNEGEVYSPDLSHEAGSEGIVVRYPHTATGEFLSIKVIDLKTLKTRIATAVNVIDKKALWDLVRSIKKGQTMLPSLVKTTVAKLGGSDFDGDGIMVILDERILKMYKHLNEGAVEFKPEEATDKLTYDKFVVETARSYGLKNGNTSTGEVVNLFYLFRSLLLDIKEGQISEEDWQELIKRAVFANPKNIYACMVNKDHKNNAYIKYTFEAEKIVDAEEAIYTSDIFKLPEREYDCKDDYKKIFDLVNHAKKGMINNQEVNMFIQSVVDNNISLGILENVKAVLESLDPAGASIVGRIIDAVKTGEKVTVPFAIISDFVKDSGKIDCKFNTETGLLEISDEIGFSWDWKNKYYTMNGREKTLYFTKNPCYFVKKALVEYVNKLASMIYSKIEEVKEDGVNKVGGIVGNVADNMAALSTALLNSRIKTSASDIYSPNSDLISYAVSEFRAITYNCDAKTRYLIAKNASAVIKDGKLDGYGRFYQSLGAENVLMAMDNEDRTVKTEVFARKAGIVAYAGEEVTIENGIGNKFFTKDNITASGHIEFEGSRTYMVSSLKEMAERAITESIDEHKVVFKIKVIDGFDKNNVATSIVATPVYNQIRFLQTLIGEQQEGREVTFAASNYVLTGKPGSKETNSDRLVVGNNAGIACFVYDYNVDKNCSISKSLNGRKIVIDHAVMIGKYGYVFGRVAH